MTQNTKNRVKCMLNAKHKKKRMRFCRWAKAFPQNYNSIIWSDESWKYLEKRVRRFVWITKGVNDYKQYVAIGAEQTISCQVWGAVSFKDGNMRVSSLQILHGNQAGPDYVRTMERALKEDVYDSGLFQHDNAPSHTSWKAKNFLDRLLARKRMGNIRWPPRSPDLSPIEYIWGRWMDKFKGSISTAEQFERLTIMAWHHCTTQQYLAIYRDRGLASIEKCIALNGGNKYMD